MGSPVALPPGFQLDPGALPPGFQIDKPAAKSSVIGDQVEGVKRSLKAQASGALDMAQSVVDPAKAKELAGKLIEAHLDQFRQAKEEYAKGNYGATVTRLLGAAVPMVGPAINNASKKMTSGAPGAVAEGITDLVAAPLLTRGVEALPEGTIPKVITGAVDAGKSAVQAAAKVPKAIGSIAKEPAVQEFAGVISPRLKSAMELGARIKKGIDAARAARASTDVAAAPVEQAASAQPAVAPSKAAPERTPIWKDLPKPSEEKFGPPQGPIQRPQLPSGRKVPGQPAPESPQEPQKFEGAYQIPPEERVNTVKTAPKESYQRAARTVKARALARWLRIGGISMEDAQAMNAEQWGMAAEGAGVNVPSPDSVKLALGELDKLYKAKGAVKIDEALKKGKDAEVNFYMDKVAKEAE